MLIRAAAWGQSENCHSIAPKPPNPVFIMGSYQTNHSMNDTYQGWANWETWNAALWIGNDEFLYNTAKACVTFREGLETPWDKFVRCMTEGQIGRMLEKTGDGVRWDDPAIDAEEMNEMLWEL